MEQKIFTNKLNYSELYSMYQLNQSLIESVIHKAKLSGNDTDILKANKRLEKLNENKNIILNTFEYGIENEKRDIIEDKG